MSHRFFIESPIQDQSLTITGQEAQHLIHVMRARLGDRVVLFDDSGYEYEAEISRIERASAVVEVKDKRLVDRELSFRLTIAAALPKGDRQKFLVEKLTELGVTTLVPLVTERGVAQPEAQAISRLKRAAIEASKQCGRNRLMSISPAISCVEFFSNAPPDARRLVAHPLESPNPLESPKDPAVAEFVRILTSGDAGSNVNGRNSDDFRYGETIVAIGPEGGFTAEEVAAAAAHGWQQLDLGPRILRVETAAIAAAVLISTQTKRR